MVKAFGTRWNLSSIVFSILFLLLVLFSFLSVLGWFDLGDVLFKIIFSGIALSLAGASTASEVNYYQFTKDIADIPKEFEKTLDDFKDNENIDIV